MADGPATTMAKTGAGGDEVDEVLVEAFAHVLGVVAAGQVLADHEHARALDLEAPPLEAGDDLADQTTSHTVGLDQHQRTFHDIPPGIDAR